MQPTSIKVREAAEQVLLGASLADLYHGHRNEMLRSVELDPTEAEAGTFRKDAMRFISKLCRYLADEHPGDRRVGAALQAWVERVDDYDAYDALLSNWERFDGRERLVARGRQLFAGPLTSHWDEEAY